jgi:hypothetical protein
VQAADRDPLSDHPHDPGDRHDPVPRAAPVVAAVLLAALVLCAVMQREEWPFSGWELFSRVRTAEERGWLATETVGGVERPIPFDRLPRGFHNSGHTLDRFPAMSVRERSAVCDAWHDALDRMHPDQPTKVIHIYRTTSALPLNGDRPVVHRIPFHTCEFFVL